MREEINIYCDESCHLEAPNPEQNSMVLGAIWCHANERRRIAEELRAIKRKHGYGPDFEVKWSNVSRIKLGFYMDTLAYFFGEPDLRYQAVVIPDKSVLQHEEFRRTHDDWYYKAYYLLLTHIVDVNKAYNVYLDIKDSKSFQKVKALQDMLKRKHVDWERKVIPRIQHVRSSEVEQVQLTDLISGAISYAYRRLTDNRAKTALVHSLQEQSGLSLLKTTALGSEKVNILCWRPNEEHGI